MLVDGLNRIGWQVTKPKATMFVWARIPAEFEAMGSLEFSTFLLQEGKVAVSPGIGFGEYGDRYVRFALIENEHRTRQAVRGIRRAPGCGRKRPSVRRWADEARVERDVRVGLIGFGTIGTGVVKLLQRSRRRFAPGSARGSTLGRIADIDLTTDRGVQGRPQAADHRCACRSSTIRRSISSSS